MEGGGWLPGCPGLGQLWGGQGCMLTVLVWIFVCFQFCFPLLVLLHVLLRLDLHQPGSFELTPFGLFFVDLFCLSVSVF